MLRGLERIKDHLKVHTKFRSLLKRLRGSMDKFHCSAKIIAYYIHMHIKSQIPVVGNHYHLKTTRRKEKSNS